MSEILKTSPKFDLAYNESIRWRHNLLLFLSTSAWNGIHVYFHEQIEYEFVVGIERYINRTFNRTLWLAFRTEQNSEKCGVWRSN